MRTQIVILCIVTACLTVNSPVLAADRLVPIIAADDNCTCSVSWWKFNEGSGTTAYDSVGINDGTIYGAQWATGQIDGALSFDGSNDYVSVPHDTLLNITGDITISSWIYLNEGAQFEAIVTKCVDNGIKNNPYDFRLTQSKLTLVRADASGHEHVYSNLEIPLGEWHHGLVRVENKVPDFYVDGVITGKYNDIVFTKTPTGNTKPVLFGRRDDGLHFNGLIDDVRIYNRALSVEEVRQVYGGADPNCPLGIWISATEFNFFADEGGPNPESQILRIRKMGMGTLNWEVTADCNWINAEPNSGSSMGEANEVTLSVDISGLTPGSHNCDLMISDHDASNSPQIVRVHLGIYGPEIDLSADQFIFVVYYSDVNPDEQTLTIRNSAGGNLNWAITSDCDWLQVEPNTGSSMGEPNEVILSVDISGLAFGIHDCNVTISDPNAVNSPQTVRVKLAFFQYALLDFGDCPDPYYPTLLINDGAYHIIDPNVFLGSSIDSDTDGQPTIWADGDDVNGIPDEDGVSFTSVLFTNCTRDVNVVASCEGKLDAWFDFNADGDWADPCEQIFASEPLNTGSNILTFSIPSDAATGDTYARFRFSTAGGLEPNGPAADGEVEDYIVSILPDCEQWLREHCFLGRRDWRDREYGYWVQFNKPECWCSSIQCHGDADGLLTFGRPVALSDLNILNAGFGKTVTELFGIPDGFCADFDHMSVFGRHVSLSDLNTLKQNFGLPESQVLADCWCGWWW